MESPGRGRTRAIERRQEGFGARNLSPRQYVVSLNRRTTCGGGTMFVSDILAQKGGLVYSVTPTTSVAEVAQQLSVRRIGSVLVLSDQSEVMGIISERDLVRAAATHGAKALEL